MEEIMNKNDNRSDDGWIKCSDTMPKRNVIVETKIHDEKGVRNVSKLIFNNKFWWLSDMSIYVYYSPTHWRTI